MVRRLTRLLVVASLLCATGAPWALLQTFAWTAMAVSNLRTQSISQAVSTALDGRHPCQLCLKAQAGARSQKKQDARAPSLRVDFFVPARTTTNAMPRFLWTLAPPAFRAAQSHDAVELPPPCLPA